MTRRTFINLSAFAAAGVSSGAAASVSAVAPRCILTAFKYGETTLPESLAFRGGMKSRRIPISLLFYMVETDGRKILVDVGCDTMPGFELRHFIRPVDLLKRYGVAPEEISDVIITHAHHDHIGTVAAYKNAVVVIQKDEAAAGARYLKGLQTETFGQNRVVAPGVEVLKIGGHTKGSSIVLLGTGKCREVLAGDECYVKKCLENRIPTGASVNPAKSEEFVRKYSSAAYKVHLYHDPSTLPGMNGRLVRTIEGFAARIRGTASPEGESFRVCPPNPDAQ